MCQRRLSAAAL